MSTEQVFARTLMIELRADPIERWYELRIDKVMMSDFIDIIRAGLRAQGTNLDVRIVDEQPPVPTDGADAK